MSALLRRTLASTDPIELCMSTVRRVTRWKGGDHVAHWIASRFFQAEEGIRRIKGFRGLTAAAKIESELASSTGGGLN